MKVLEENAGSILLDISVGKDFLSKAPLAQELRPTNDKRDVVKLKHFCTAKEIFDQVIKKATERERIFASYASHRELIYPERIYT